MYCDFYQLTERPFNVTPDPKFLYLNARYREAIASLNYGITQRKGFITLIGEAGTGKTTLLNKLLEDLDKSTKSVFVFNTNVTFEEILEYIFAEFDLPVHNGKKLYMLQRLNAFLLEELRGGGNVALLIDEAQDLEFSVLEDLRLLSNLETAKEKILQIVLSGQPELGQKLSNPVLRQLRQRIGINCRLLPLSREEITEYIQYRLQAAGCADLKLFSRDAEDRIYHFSRGIPRLVNVVCDNALVIGYALAKRRIGADVVNEAAADLLAMEAPLAVSDVHAEPVPAPTPSAAPQGRRSRLAAIGLVAAAVIVGLFAAGRMLWSRGGASEDQLAAARVSQPLEVIRPGSQPSGSGLDMPVVRRGEEASAVGTGERPVAEPPAPVRPRPPMARAAEGIAGGQPRVAADPGDGKPAAVPAVPPEPARHAMQEHAMAPAAAPQVVARTQSQPVPGRITEERLPAQRGDEAALKPADKVVAAVPALAPAAAGASARPEEGAARRVPRAEQNTQAAKNALKEATSTPPIDADDAVPVARAQRLDGVQFAEVTVRTGDSMSGIAMRKYGQATPTVLDLLKIANPELRDIDVISAGQTLRLPELGDGFPILNDGSGRYSLLVLSSSQARRAAMLQGALRGHGFDAHVADARNGSQRPVFRVLLTGFASRDEVIQVGKELQKIFREDTRLTALGE